MKIVKMGISYFVLLVFLKYSLFAFEVDKFKLDINNNHIEDEILIIYKDYILDNQIVDVNLLIKEGFDEEFYQLTEYKIKIDNSIEKNFILKEIKYIQNNYVNGYTYEIKVLKDNGFMIEITTNTSLIYNIFFTYEKNSIILKHILYRNIYQDNYMICGVNLDVNVNNKIVDIDLLDNEKVCYSDNEQIIIRTKTLQKYNDIAYYLQQAKANDEAIFLLENIIEKFPNRTVAYLNLADAYDGKNETEKAKINYEKYISLMKKSGKENKIPKKDLEYK